MLCGAVAGHPIVENFLAGYNSSIFAYGQTGAGKTYTMIGQLGRSDQVSFAFALFCYYTPAVIKQRLGNSRQSLVFCAVLFCGVSPCDAIWHKAKAWASLRVSSVSQLHCMHAVMWSNADVVMLTLVCNAKDIV